MRRKRVGKTEGIQLGNGNCAIFYNNVALFLDLSPSVICLRTLILIKISTSIINKNVKK